MFPVEVHIHLEWQNGEVRFPVESDVSMGEIVTKVCGEHGQDPLLYSMALGSPANGSLNLTPVPSATLISKLVHDGGKQALNLLRIVAAARRPSVILGQKVQQLRQANPGSLRLKNVDVKLSTSLLDLNAASTQIHALPSFKGVRRFSEPANLRTHVHAPLNPLVLPKSVMFKGLKDMGTITRIKEENLRKSRSHSFTSKRPGTILRKKIIANKNISRTFDGKEWQFMESYFLCIKLPNDTYMTTQVGSDTILEEILKVVVRKKSFLLQKNEIAAEKFTLELPATEPGGPGQQMEMDRPLGYYHNPKVLCLIYKEKKYSTMYMNENGTDVMILKCVNGKFHVMAATKEKCIERVSDDEKSDKAFREILLLTFRSFMTPEEFLDELSNRYHCVPPENATEEELKYFEKGKKTVRENVFYVIKEWCKWYYHDFAVSESLRQKLKVFVDEIVQDLAEMDEVIRVQCAELPKLIVHMSDRYDQMFTVVKSLNRKSKPVDSMLKKAKPSELAEQLCLWDQFLFKNISSIEFLNQIWKDPEEKEYHSPNLTYFIQRFEKESYWIATEICAVADLNKRVAILKKCIELVKECLDRNNLFSVFSILAGLNLTPVQRLKKTWAGIGKVHQKLYSDMEKLSDPSKNMQAYRTRIANATPPVIPFLPIFLKDMIFFNDGNPSKLQGGLINIEKLRMMTDQIKSMTLMAHVPYKYAEDSAIRNYLLNAKIESLKPLIEQSDILEPRTLK